MMQPQGKHMTFQPRGLKSGTPPTNKCHSICPPDCYLQNLSHSRCLLWPVSLPALPACKWCPPRLSPVLTTGLVPPPSSPEVSLWRAWTVLSPPCVYASIYFDQSAHERLALNTPAVQESLIYFLFSCFILEDDHSMFNGDAHQKCSAATLLGRTCRYQWFLGPCVCCQLLSWTKRLKVHILAVLGETTEEIQAGEAATNSKQHTRSKQVCRKFYWRTSMWQADRFHFPRLAYPLQTHSTGSLPDGWTKSIYETLHLLAKLWFIFIFLVFIQLA